VRLGSSKPIRQIQTALKRRGVTRLVYFHTDHFEPWRHVPDRPAEWLEAIADVEQYARGAAAHEFSRRPTLFLKSNVNFAVDARRELYRAAPEDKLGFVPRNDEARAVGRAFMAPLLALGADIQVHIHHENFTWNGKLADPTTRDYLMTPPGKAFGPARLETAIRLNLALIEEDGGPALDRWFFVHGHWALNASDLGECTIVREIELLMRNGCLGDFTQPAGRPHVDGRIGTPHLVDAVARPKGYDDAAARPAPAYGAGDEAARRFFLWASIVDHRNASIDCYSAFVAKRAEQPWQFGLAHAERGVVLGDTLYVKTHAHSMAPPYWSGDRRGAFPHADAGIRAELGTLFDAASAAGVEIAFLTVPEVYGEIVHGDGPGADLPRRDGAPPAATDALVVRDAAGLAVVPPPLPPAADLLLSRWHDGEAPPGPEPEIVPIQPRAAPPPTDGFADACRRVNRIGSAVVAERLGGDEAMRQGLTGYYVARSIAGELLQPAEIGLADYVRSAFPAALPVVEIGCGTGLLTILLAASGRRAIGLDSDGGRVAAAQAIADAVAQDSPIPCAPTFLRSRFPVAVGDAQDGVALVTNLLGTADAAEQRRFVEGLDQFSSVIIDLDRFYDRRTAGEGHSVLTGYFRQAGFSAPVPLSIRGEGTHVRFDRQPRLVRALMRFARRLSS
jgi:hypothetical protein